MVPGSDEMIGGIIVSHGKLGEELLNALNIILGEAVNIEAISIGWYDDVEESKLKINQSLKRVDQKNGVLIFKILRNALDAPYRGKVCIVGRNPEAIWFDDYEDRVLFDEAGLFDYTRVENRTVKIEDLMNRGVL